MAPCKEQCWFCPFRKPIQVADRLFRATYFAAICLKAAVPGRHPNLDCMINCIGMARDVCELLNCGEDYHDLWYWAVDKSEPKARSVRRLDQGASIFSLLSSLVTTSAVFHEYDVISLGKWGKLAGDASRALSIVGHACALGSLMTAKSPEDDTFEEALTSIAEGSYMALELFMERTSIPVQGVIGVTTALWGIYENRPEKLLSG